MKLAPSIKHWLRPPFCFLLASALIFALAPVVSDFRLFVFTVAAAFMLTAISLVWIVLEWADLWCSTELSAEQRRKEEAEMAMRERGHAPH